MNENTSHIICPSVQRDKIKEGLKQVQPIEIVTIEWLNSCCERWCKVDENLFRPKDYHLLKKRENRSDGTVINPLKRVKEAEEE